MTILNLSISKVSPGVYAAVCEGAPVPSTSHGSISEALMHYGDDVPAFFATFVNIEYGGCRLETMPITTLKDNSEQLASRLVQIVSEVQNNVVQL